MANGRRAACLGNSTAFFCRIFDAYASQGLLLSAFTIFFIVKRKGKLGGLLSGIWREAPLARLHTITPWSQDLFIRKPSQLPGDQRDRLQFRRTGLLKHTSLYCPTRYPHILLDRESARVGKVPCLGAQRLSIIQVAQPEIEPAIARSEVAHATTELRLPTVQRLLNHLWPLSLCAVPLVRLAFTI